jgi:hypothetical protein
MFIFFAVNDCDVKHDAPLPSIRVVDAVTDKPATSVVFSDWRWHVSGYSLKATMTWNGFQRVDSLTYTLRRDGVVVGRGYVNVHGGGMRRGEPVEVWMSFRSDARQNADLIIEVMH